MRTRNLARRDNPIVKAPLIHEGVMTEWTAGATPRARDQILARREAGAEAVGTIQKGIERYIVSKGQFSLIDVLRGVLNQTGPAFVTFSTWTAAGLHVSEVYDLWQAGKLTDTRWLIDHTFQRRQPHVAGQLMNLFTNERIRVTRNHAKLALVRNDDWDVNIFTSMNLNVNRRMEYLLIREDRELADFNETWIGDIFRRHRPLENWGRTNSWHRQAFNREFQS